MKKIMECQKLRTLALSKSITSGLFNAINLELDPQFKQAKEYVLDSLMPEFLQAVFDGNIDRVKSLLDVYPELLVRDQLNNPGLVIESELTGQRFYAAKPLTIAVLRRHPAMIEALLPYFDTLQVRGLIDDAKFEALQQWGDHSPEIPEIAGFTDKWVSLYLQDSDFTFLSGILSHFPDTTRDDRVNRIYQAVVEETENALMILEKFFSLDEPINLHNTINYGKFLYTAYVALARKSYCYEYLEQVTRRFIGLIQRFATPVIAQYLCEGHEYYYGYFENSPEAIKNRNPNARKFITRDGKQFYPSQEKRQNKQGLGYDFHINNLGYTDIPNERYPSLPMAYSMLDLSGLERIIGKIDLDIAKLYSKIAVSNEVEDISNNLPIFNL